MGGSAPIPLFRCSVIGKKSSHLDTHSVRSIEDVDFI